MDERTETSDDQGDEVVGSALGCLVDVDEGAGEEEDDKDDGGG